ncbi:MAG: TrbG/VirB9 family P-type conjugative transfer protein [Sphingomonas sp.]|uniref:TrbG/VirB9 family P-type conjugative transfer protein n=1 Tax=Sphingomonas sp. TaxID=28214 RepID=UPI00185AFD19|nr:TrbG/VirB9 family P-type conjugative transfer protein [Sphingomonas sp.]MBA3667379.1 TrbG/VirB9 family P-type conjugative transfer protein [Sphingomonas sp.]
MRRAVILALFLLTAARLPDPSGADPHIQSIMFEPDEVVRLQGALGWQIMLEFGPDERIENVSIGDALAWQVTPNKKARNLFLKPLAKKAATNMTVVTDKRRYAFSLETTPRLRNTPWVVRFDYPREIVEAIEEPPPPPPPSLNFAYGMDGAKELLPARVWDDGLMTYFEFADNSPIPAIFANGPGKTESLVNSSMRGRVMVVQQTSGRFTLRTGKRLATITYGTGGKP